ncbi:MAG: nucleotidyl transferase AbiEii/AbiGii toxin family protein [Lentisphaerae bacterium]|nr:nucleotidyl transferase AbiEii/AbiGii toxin family protein [Lentisphaerota bacterium]MBT4817829.1 nucleotidyl transferase AbiEii/AbiGii toxin family protein [Lentisphaerota bacterium]MBT5607373.1 nucleotidyl transferase AbiEii/AbiGii toxin family protein [Lentisphaerota bacterium]MBT7058383.1 nucleotidyl transferase AbiEii/AbiGii toxin family protein [Lentisphaerota bacterium]MBT7841700.1 nucleotidyl transferase AbiEii/AbiGii toxin family protein [Lentisphaerota bacterium]
MSDAHERYSPTPTECLCDTIARGGVGASARDVDRGQNQGCTVDRDTFLVAEAGGGGQGQVFDPEVMLRAAESVVGVLKRHRVDAVVIGATALAAYRYVRQTEDIDLGVNADLATLRAITESLRGGGFSAELREPDGDDPLGGVIDVTGGGGLLQIISYANRFPAVIDDAVRGANLTVRAGSPLRLVPIAQLIALKLYAGGYKSKADIVELLTRNPELDLNEVRAVCNRYRLSGLEELIADAR